MKGLSFIDYAMIVVSAALIWSKLDQIHEVLLDLSPEPEQVQQ